MKKSSCFFKDLRPGCKFIILPNQAAFHKYCIDSCLIFCKLQAENQAVILNNGEIIDIEPNLQVLKIAL